MSEIITKDNERIVMFFKSLDRMLAGIENLVKCRKPTLNGERYLTDSEVSDRLRISRRTLQDYAFTEKNLYICERINYNFYINQPPARELLK